MEEALALLFDMAPAEEVDRYHGGDVHVTRRWLNCVSSQDATSATFSRLCRRASSIAMQRSDADGTVPVHGSSGVAHGYAP